MTIRRDNWTVTWGDASVTSTIGVMFLDTRVRSDIEKPMGNLNGIAFKSAIN